MPNVSLREYARLRGCSEGAVREAIRTGKIVDGVIKNEKGINKKINVSVADNEWARNYREDRKGSRNFDLHSNLENASKNNNKPEPEIKVITTSDGPPQTKANDETHDEPDEEIGMAEAKRREAVAKAQILEIELAEKQREVINTATVKRAMYEFGEEVKSAILSVPDRAIDDVLAANTRNEAHLILNSALMDALTKLSTSKIMQNEWATK